MGIARLRFMAVTVALVGSGLAIALLKAQSGPQPWVVGDVFVAIGNGKYEVRSNTGALKETITIGTSSYYGDTAGCWFDSQFNLYTTDFQNTRVFKFDLATHVPSLFADTGVQAPNGQSSSIVMAVNGDVYVGHAGDGEGGQRKLLQYRSDGAFLDSDTPVTEFGGGIDWIDLSTDHSTMFYTSRGRLIKRFNVVSDTPLSDFATLPGSTPISTAFAIRLLGPSFNGNDGLLVADNENIKRLNGAGGVVATYDAATEDSWEALNLDPDGVTFWAGGRTTGKLYRFNLASGTLAAGPFQTATDNLRGICVMGEAQLQIRPLNLSTGAGSIVLKDITAPFGNPASTAETAFNSFSTWRLRIRVKPSQSIVAAVSFTPQSTNLSPGSDTTPFDSRFTATPAQCVPFFKDPSRQSTDDDSKDPYRCAYYRVKDMPACTSPGSCPFDEPFIPGGAPGSGGVQGDVLLNLTNPPTSVFNVELLGYGPLPKGNPRIMRDPDAVNTGMLADQFFIDATTAVIDWPAFGTGTPNDYSPVQRETSTAGGGCADIIKPDKDSFNGGSAIKVRIRVTDGPRVNGVCTGNPISNANTGTHNITLAIANPALGVLEIYCETPGNSLGCFKEAEKKSPGEYQSTVDLTNPPFIPSTQHPYFFAVTSVNVPSADPSPAAQGAGQFPPVGRSYFICPQGGNCGS
jgi:hypothetical protein